MVHCAPKHGLDQTGMRFARKFGVGWVKIMGTPNNIKLVFGAWHLLVLAISETPSVSTIARRACHCHRAGTRCSTGPPSKAPHLRTEDIEDQSCAAWLHPKRPRPNPHDPTGFAHRNISPAARRPTLRPTSPLHICVSLPLVTLVTEVY